MLTPTLRTGSELSTGEKADIIQRMFAVQNPGERDAMRKSLVTQYGISEGTINSLIAHETMRRKKNAEGAQIGFQEGEVKLSPTHVEQEVASPTQALQQTTQTRAYAITSLSGITEQMREDILEEFSDVIQDNASNSRYDFYQDIEAMSEYYSIDPNILEQFLRNKYNWLGFKLDELRNGRVLSEEDKLNIRLYVSEGIDEKDRKARRKEMAQTYNVSTYVIGAITAWKLNEDGGVVLKKDALDTIPVQNASGNDEGVLEIPQKIEPVVVGNVGNLVGETISEVAPDDEVVSLQVGISEDSQVPKNGGEAIGEGTFSFSEDDKIFVQELAKDFDLNNDEQRKVFLDDVFDLFPESTIDDVKRIISDFPDDTIHINTKRSGEGMGALVEYDNEIKNKWRQKIKEFIDENTDVTKRKDMKVLCLPGIECLEIPLYLELGFKPENIIGVEAGIVKGRKDPEVIRRFQTNANRYGIQTRIGKLEKILETEETIFDVVSLDFLGPVNNNANHILKIIKYTHRSIVLTNFQGKREWKQQDVLRHFESKHDGTGKMLHNGRIGYIVEEENSGIELKETRDGLAIGAFVANAAFQGGYVANYGAYGKVIPQIAFSIRHLIEKYSSEGVLKEMHYEAIQLFMMNESYRLATALTDSLPYKPKDEIIGRIHVFLRSILASTNFVMQHKSYVYKGNNVPMLSDMIVLEGLDMNIFDKKYPDLTSFIMKILMYTFSNEGIRGVKFQNIKIGNIKKIGRIIVCGNDGKIVATIDHLKFMNELWEFGKWYAKKNVFASKREQIL